LTSIANPSKHISLVEIPDSIQSIQETNPTSSCTDSSAVVNCSPFQGDDGDDEYAGLMNDGLGDDDDEQDEDVGDEKKGKRHTLPIGSLVNSVEKLRSAEIAILQDSHLFIGFTEHFGFHSHPPCL
jgi:hypothetical protein